jgi:hypothetical protein
MPYIYEAETMGTAAKGKQAELIAIGRLLERGYKIYTPLVDTGIDCLVDVGEGNYKEIQVKYREDQPIFAARTFRPRDNFYFICYLSTRRGSDFWIIPSKVFHELGVPAKVGNREYIQLRIGKEGSESYNRLINYHENFSTLLTGATKEVRQSVRLASQRITGPHLTQSTFESEILAILCAEAVPLERMQIVRKLYERLHERFSDADREFDRSGMARWEKTARWAVTNLKTKGLIQSIGRNQWTITAKGREAALTRPKTI